MKSFKQFIKEAKNPVPSALKKFKQGTREVENTYIAGDIYDFSDGNRYTQKDSYYQGDGDGYIMDKSGNVYDVKCSEGSGDAGRIAGGSYHISVRILRVGPKQENIILSGYSAIFSRPSSDTFGSLISDIKDGIYLEDYLAYHEHDIDYGQIKTDWVQALIKAGNGEGSRTTKMKKRDEKINKEESFNQRYCIIKDKMAFTCTGGHKLKYWENGGWSKICAEIKPSSTKNKDKDGRFGRENAEQSVKVPEEVHNAICDAYSTLAEEIVQSMFGSADLKGLQFEFNVWFEGKGEYGNPASFAWDIKKKQFVVIDMSKRKVLDRKFELRLTTVFHRHYKGETVELSDYVKKFFIDASKINIKLLGSESKYVADNYKSVMWGKGYWKPEMKAGEAKQQCKEQFARMKRNEEFDPENPKFEYYISPSVVSQVLGGKSYQKYMVTEKPEVETTESPDMTPEVTNGPSKPQSNTKSAEETYGKAYGPAKEKMEKWHAGTRKQNLKNCNDSKLRMNFAICKELGYDEECKQIAAEAKKRGIILESRVSLTDLIQCLLS